MKFFLKHLKLIILIFICFLIFLIYQLNNKNNINYLAMGDGLSLGLNSYGIIDYNYSDYIRDYLKENHKLNKYIKAYSEKDMSIEKLYNYILINKEMKINNKPINLKEALRESNILTLSVGINDLKYKLSLIDNITNYNLNNLVKETEISLNKLIKEIKKYYKGNIYFIGYYPADCNSYLLNYTIKRLNKIIESRKDLIYIDTIDISENNNFLANPTNHYPTTQGYQKIAELVINKLQKEKNLQKT